MAQLPAAIVASSEGSSYVIKIDGYSRLKGQIEHGNYVQSTPFTVGDHDWAVEYYPNGCYAEKYEAGFISVFLALYSDVSNDVKAKVGFSLLDKDGEPVESKSMITHEHIFDSKGSDWGFSNFIKVADLESSVHLRDDSFSIRCDVTVMKPVHKVNRFIVVPPSNLHQHLGDLLISLDGADVTFRVGGESFLAHRSVLAARSLVFRAELFGPMKESGNSLIEISDMESDVFKSLLHFIYTDSLPVPETTDEGETGREMVIAGHLLVAADRYNIERLKLICEEKLCNLIDSDVVATSLALAEQHGLHRIKEACFEFLASPSNLETMMASDGYEHLKNSCPSVLRELAASFLPAELKAVKDIIMTT
ncbi:BTB/POZ and MATH domain-containing protein 1-like [Triticum dicoccoides]|uniref:BTB/POZ and MATH domain-containing protein 1-like n=1 Tax=Triticum dicoccoides TaxID=85692 RepID=UPI000E794F46|nr:BTB/POZ and MATH domain-containing protein 1-like [Triticum dicoccoides]